MAGVATLCGVLAAPIAQAATPCLTRPEIRALATYVMPPAIAATAQRCAPSLPGSAALPARAAALVAELEPLRAAVFPQARSAFGKFASQGKDAAGVMDRLPETAFRPLVDAMIEQELVSDVKPQTCRDIDRVAATLAPLSGSDLTDFLTEVLMIAARDNKRMRSCPDS